MDSAAIRKVELTRAQEHSLGVARLAESQMIKESRLEDSGTWGSLVVIRLVVEVEKAQNRNLQGQQNTNRD